MKICYTTSMEKKTVKEMVWDSLKAPLVVSLVLASVFLICFYMIDQIQQAWIMFSTVFLLVFYISGIKQVIESVRFIRRQEKALKISYADTRFNEDWYASRIGPYFILVNHQYIKEILQNEVFDRSKYDKKILCYRIIFTTCKDEEDYFYLPYDKKELDRFQTWYREFETEIA